MNTVDPFKPDKAVHRNERPRDMRKLGDSLTKDLENAGWGFEDPRNIGVFGRTGDDPLVWAHVYETCAKAVGSAHLPERRCHRCGEADRAHDLLLPLRGENAG